MVLRAGTFGSGFSNAVERFETTYDFTADAGAQGTFVMTAGAEEACMVRLIGLKCTTAAASTSGVISLGTSAAATAFINAETYATFSLAAFVSPETTGDVKGFVKVAADATLDLTIGTDDLTAGKFVCVWEVMKY